MSNKKATTTKAITKADEATKPALPRSWAKEKSRTVVRDSAASAAVVSAILSPLTNVTGPDGEVQNLSTSVAFEMIEALMADLGPCSAIERMLIEQLAITHAQIIRTHRMVTQTDYYDHKEQMLGAASRLQADYRKTVMTLKELRAPSKNVIFAQQANIAQQQVVTQTNQTTSGAST